jgi:hypothetical protein
MIIPAETPLYLVPHMKPATIDKGQFTDDPPGAYDVLCGKGRERSLHLGNQRFKAIIALNVPTYHRAGNRRSLKTKVVKSVLRDVQTLGSRFFEKSGGRDARWVEIHKEKIKCDKIGHALRDNSSSSSDALHRAHRFMKAYGFKHMGGSVDYVPGVDDDADDAVSSGPPNSVLMAGTIWHSSPLKAKKHSATTAMQTTAQATKRIAHHPFLVEECVDDIVQREASQTFLVIRGETC